MTEDPLAPLLAHFKAQARLFYSGNLCGDVTFGDELGTGFLHLLKAGSIQMQDSSGYAVTLTEPTLVFYSRPLQHRFHVDPNNGADLVCASMRFEHMAFNPILLALPERFECPLSALKGTETLLELLFSEAFDVRPGRQEVLDRLFEILLIDVLRVVLAREETAPGLFRSLLHPQISKALNAIHKDPGQDWSLEALANFAGMSRSSFAAVFKQEVGDTPGNYLTRWRIILSQALIREGVPLKLVAERVGYDSQAGFLRAFKIVMGQSPTSWKTSQ
ncbi:AraC-like DNA-binding protein [Oxalobacteraceae bacterium GrIS 2.11]